MSSQLYIPIQNPLQFVDVNPTQDTTIYATRHIDDFLFEDQIYKFQNKIPWFQPWVNEDIIRLQFESNYFPLQLDMYDQFGRIIVGKSASMTVKRTNRYLPGFNVLEAALSLTGLNAGPYRYICTPGGNPDKAQKSEWFTILPNPTDTIRLDYFNSTYHEDVLYETGIVFSLRIPGYIEYDAPGNKIVTFENQTLNQTVVSGRRFRQIILHVGDGSGVPPWLIDKINSAMTCDNCAFDNKLLAFVDGKWSPEGDKDTQLKGFSTSLRENLNRASKIVTADFDPNKKITLIANIEGRLFGDVSANAGETVIRILDQE